MRVLTLLEMRVLPSAAEARTGRPSGPLVVIANHPTLVDVTAILASFDDVCCVVKSSLIHDAFVGPLLRACGHIDGGSGEIMSGAVIMQEAQERLDAGFAVLIFPEGTRSPPWGLHPFRRGAFELAARARVAIWPLFVTCNPPALSKGVPFWRQPGRVARLGIQPGELIPAHASARAARSAVEALFRAHRALQPASPEPAPRQCVKAVAPTAAACAIEPFAETPREGVSTKPA
jgi:1-acyl-sn-glycerol-3-phosphate acyltransferase